LAGGHSGVDILLQRANANRLVARALLALADKVGYALEAIRGGSARNAIPRDARAVIRVAPGDADAVRKAVAEFAETAAKENAATDPNLQVTCEPGDGGLGIDGRRVFTGRSRDTLVALLLGLPHGVERMSPSLPGLVQTSTNLATVTMDSGKVVIHSSQRSSADSEIKALSDRVSAVAGLAGCEIRREEGYPGWDPDPESGLLARCLEVYGKTLGARPEVKAIHAGLECGVIGAKYPGMEMISIGPLIENPHSPDERLSYSSLVKMTKFLWELAAEFAK